MVENARNLRKLFISMIMWDNSTRFLWRDGGRAVAQSRPQSHLVKPDGPAYRSRLSGGWGRGGRGFLLGGVFLALEVSDTALAFFGFVILLSHKSLLCFDI
jgi:hypothetical protein